ncbi:MAG: LysR substrate-binding domain-containing protein [Dongiaceae bacterium]
MAEKRKSAQRQKTQSRLSLTEPEPAAIAQHLPPLNAVRAFEAAARHQSFARAAAELHVSAGAVSRQVKLLEEALGESLFRRDARAVQLTAQGRRLLPLAEQAFDLLRQMLPGRGPDGVLRLRVSASLYLRWLLPRLPDLQQALPKLKVDLTITSTHATDQGGADATIYYRRRDASPSSARDTRHEKLSDDLLFEDGSILVCAPRLLPRRRLPLSPAALRRLPILLNTPDGWDWRALADHIGLPDLPLNGAHSFDIDDSAIQAALAGQGVALVEQRFVTDQLAAGQLIRPFDLPPLSLGDYRIRWSGSALRRRIARQLRDWLLMAARASLGS